MHFWGILKNCRTHYKNNFQGIPQQFGIFYAMGVALMFEGILSGCYHICPTNENFQFDTTFMYVVLVIFIKTFPTFFVRYIIAMIMFTKVFQFRHPDLSANAYKLFLVIALIIFMEVIGIFYGSNFFWIVFLIGYGLGIILISFIFYFSNQLEADRDQV